MSDAPSPSASPQHHEPDEVSLGAVLAIAGVMVVSAVIIQLGLWGALEAYRAWDLQRKQSTFPLAVEEGRPLPTPLLEGLEPLRRTPSPATSDMRPPESYGWVDRQAGIVHMPLDQAMKLIVDNDLLPAHAKKVEDMPRPPGRANSGRTKGGQP